MVQAVALTADWLPTSVCVTSLEEQARPFGAVNPGVIVSVLAPVVPVQVIWPLQEPPFCVEVVAQAPVPDNPAAGPPATKLLLAATPEE